MNCLRVCLLLFAVTVVVAVRAEETNTPSTASATSNAAPSGVTSNAAPSSIKIEGTTYEEVRWGRVTLSTVTIFHKTGVATIPLWKLPKELQERFGYDPQKSFALEDARRKAARSQYLRRINGIIYDFSPMVAAFDEAILIEKQEPHPGRGWGYTPPGGRWAPQWTQEEVDGVERAKTAWNLNVYQPWQKKLEAAYSRAHGYRQYTLAGKVIQVVNDGLLVETEPIANISDGLGFVFVKNHRDQKTVFDGDHILCPIVMLVDRYRYADTTGATRTIPLYDCGEVVQDSDIKGEVVQIKPH